MNVNDNLIWYESTILDCKVVDRNSEDKYLDIEWNEVFVLLFDRDEEKK